MIFHLSHPQEDSVNYHTPRELCTTQYNEFDVAIRLCLKAGVGAHMARSDLKSGRFINTIGMATVSFVCHSVSALAYLMLTPCKSLDFSI